MPQIPDPGFCEYHDFVTLTLYMMLETLDLGTLTMSDAEKVYVIVSFRDLPQSFTNAATYYDFTKLAVFGQTLTAHNSVVHRLKEKKLWV